MAVQPWPEVAGDEPDTRTRQKTIIHAVPILHTLFAQTERLDDVSRQMLHDCKSHKDDAPTLSQFQFT
jgi:hypothetical protein